MDKRINYIDIAKCLGIVAVVMGHCGIAHNFVYQFHMPLFIFLSGMMHKSITGFSFFSVKRFVKKKIFSYYLPYILYELVFMLSHNLQISFNLISYKFNGKMGGLYSYNIMFLLKHLMAIILMIHGEILLGTFWFLVAVFQLSLLFEAILFLTSKYLFKSSRAKCFFVIFVTISLTVIGYEISLPASFDTALRLLPYYSSGYYFKYRQSFLKQPKTIKLYSITCWLVVILCMQLNDSYTSTKFMILPFISGFFGIFGVILVSNFIESICQNKIKNIMTFVGKNSFYIMTFHFLTFKFVNFIQVILYNKDLIEISSFPILDSSGSWRLSYLLIGIILPLLIGKIIGLIKHFMIVWLKQEYEATGKQSIID